MDDYFGMALLQRLDNIERKLNQPQNIIVNVCLDNVSDEVTNKFINAIREINK